MNSTGARVIESDVPARLDRMSWSRWHWMIVFALGITRVLDDLEVRLFGNAGPGGRLLRHDGCVQPRALVRKESL